MKIFEDPQTGASQLRHLTIGNITVNQDLLDYILTKLLPNLLALELFNLKHSSFSQQNRMFLPLLDLVQDYPSSPVLVRLKISHINLRSQLDGIIELINYASASLMDLELSWCNMNLDNFASLAACIKQTGLDHAEQENNGVRTGTLRKLNLSYNPFMGKGERMTDSVGVGIR